MNNTCQNCPDRRLFCHSNCERHQIALKEKDAQKSIKRAMDKRENDVNEYHIEATRRAKAK
jgi:hypothetical protein